MIRFAQYISEQITNQYTSLTGDIKTIAQADDIEILKDLVNPDEGYASEVLGEVLGLEDPASLKRTQKVRKELANISQKSIKGSGKISVYRIGEVKGSMPLSFSLSNNPKIISGLPWAQRLKDKTMYEYEVNKKDILVAPNAILRPGKGTDNEMEVIIMPNKVKRK